MSFLSQAQSRLTVDFPVMATVRLRYGTPYRNRATDLHQLLVSNAECSCLDSIQMNDAMAKILAACE